MAGHMKTYTVKFKIKALTFLKGILPNKSSDRAERFFKDFSAELGPENFKMAAKIVAVELKRGRRVRLQLKDGGTVLFHLRNGSIFHKKED